MYDEVRRCVIIGGPDIGNYEFIKNKLCPDDYFIYCDSGLKHRDNLGIEPDLVIGDFDSYEEPSGDFEVIVLPIAKDDTDTVFAAKEAMARGFENFLLIGVIGGRIDHTMGNIAILLMLDTAKKKAEIIDDYSELEIVSNGKAYVDESYPFFSLLSATGYAKGVTVRNAKFALDNAEISCDYQYGVSNEVMPGKIAEIEVKEGRLLLVKDRA